MFGTSIVAIVLALMLFVLPQSFWDRIIKNIKFVESFLEGKGGILLWNRVFERKKRRYSTGILLLFLGLLLLALSIPEIYVKVNNVFKN